MFCGHSVFSSSSQEGTTFGKMWNSVYIWNDLHFYDDDIVLNQHNKKVWSASVLYLTISITQIA